MTPAETDPCHSLATSERRWLPTTTALAPSMLASMAMLASTLPQAGTSTSRALAAAGTSAAHFRKPAASLSSTTGSRRSSATGPGRPSRECSPGGQTTCVTISSMPPGASRSAAQRKAGFEEALCSSAASTRSRRVPWAHSMRLAGSRTTSTGTCEPRAIRSAVLPISQRGACRSPSAATTSSRASRSAASSVSSRSATPCSSSLVT